MTEQSIYDILNEKAPFATAEEWDNPGLLVGSPQQEITGILVALDATPGAVAAAEAIGANLLVNYAVSKMQVVKLSSFGAVTSLVSMFAGVIFLDEPISASLLLGAVLILVGVYQVTKPKK